MTLTTAQQSLDEAQAALAQGDYARAYDLSSACLKAIPQLHAARALRVNAGLQLQRWRDAIGDLQMLLQVMPQQAQFRRLLAVCWLRTGNEHRDKKEVSASIAAYRTAIDIDPAAQDARYNLALLIKDTRQWVEAIDLLAKVIAAEPDNLEARLHQAELLLDVPREVEALAQLRYIAPRQMNDPALVELCCKLLVSAGGISEAVELALRHFNAHPQRWREAWFLALKWREEDALESANLLLDHMLLLTSDPALRFRFTVARQLGLPSTYSSANDVILGRTHYTDALNTLIDEYPAQRLAQMQLDPALLSWSNFLLAYQGEDDRTLQTRYGTWLSSAMSLCTRDIQPLPSVQRQRPRLVFVSSFFRESTVGVYFLSWVEYLAKWGWELIVIQLGPLSDDLTDRFARSADQLLRFPAEPLQELVKTISALNADILLYPELGMNFRIFTLAALRLARVQVCAWGHPITSGLPTIDAFLSCAEMEPPDAQQHYSERLLVLPGLGTRYLSPAIPAQSTRSELGLPESRHLYLVPQSPFKLHPENDAVLVEVLRRDPTALFVLFNGVQLGAARKLRQRLLQALGRISSTPENHLHFFPQGSRDKFLRVNLVCDVMLDSLYWSGGNTTLDALHCGLPIVTCPGKFMRSRQSMAMLRTLGCEELIVEDAIQLADCAVKIARDSVLRETLSARIHARLPLLTDSDLPLQALDRQLRALLNPGALN